LSVIGNDIDYAASLLQQGKLVAIPTETVYGLAANALNEEAVLKIFKAKERPLFDPLIMHLPSFTLVEKYCKSIPTLAYQLAEKFSPGPITFLLDRKENVPDLITSGLPQVAVRIPDHQLTLELLNKLDFPLAAPSANPFGYISPTTAQHVQQQLGEKIDYILDGGDCRVGVESTIIGFENEKIIVYRLGGLSIEELEAFAAVELRINSSSDPKAPGQLKTHYAPRKPLIIGNIEELLKANAGRKMSVMSFSKKYTTDTIVLSETEDLSEAAKKLFSVMRELDAQDCEFILAEEFPDSFLGKAINDRLRRAATRD